MTFNSHPFREQFHVAGGASRRFANLWFNRGRVSRTHTSVQAIIRNLGDDPVTLQVQLANRPDSVLDSDSFVDEGAAITICPGGVQNFTVSEGDFNILSLVSTSMEADEYSNILITGMANAEGVWIQENEFDWYRENVSGTSAYVLDFDDPQALSGIAGSSEVNYVSGTGDTTIPASAIQFGWAAVGGAIVVDGVTMPNGTSNTVYGPFSDDIEISGSSAVWDYTTR